MPKKKTVKEALPAMKLKYKDIFDLKEFYLALREWVVDNGWKDEEDSTDHMESLYGEKVSGGGREIFFWWRLFKPAEGAKLNYYIDMDFHCLAIKDTEVIKDGTKIKVNKGEINIEIKSFIDLVYESELSGNWLTREFKSFFTKKIYTKQIELRRKELYQEIYAFNNYIKQWFKLRRYLPHEESKEFFKSYAWPSHVKDG
jgi:hypothetical protein